MITAALRKIKSKSTNKCSFDTESEIITSFAVCNDTTLNEVDYFVNDTTHQRQISIMNDQKTSALSIDLNTFPRPHRRKKEKITATKHQTTPH